VQRKDPRLRHGKASVQRNLKQWIAQNVIVPLAYAFIKFSLRTWKLFRTNPQAGQMRPCILAILHGDLIVGAMELKELLPEVDVLASRSRDGSLVARFVHLNHARTIRGGSSKGATGALLQMRRSLLRGRKVVIPVDGPRGPYGVVKPGVIAVASQTNAPIIAGAVIASKAWRFRSWDRAFIAKPVAKVAFIYGEPLYVPAEATREQIEEYRLRLENQLAEMHTQNPF
jgi:lysophospholipid acyltransferase (LPLAT)-like uncharacterized protein